MKKFYVLAAASAFVIFSCSKETRMQETISGEKVTYQVVIADETKAQLVDGSDAEHITLKWKEGDKLAFQFSDDSVQEGTVSLSGSEAHVSVVVPSGETLTDCWFPYSDTKPTAIPANQSASTISFPLVKSDITGNTVTLLALVEDWSIVRVALKKGSVGEARTLKYVKIKNNNGSAKPDLIQMNTTATLTDEVQYFDFVVPAAECKPLEIIVGDSNGLEYRRKLAANVTLAKEKTYRLPVIADVDDSGRYTWIFKGENGPVGSELANNAPFTYWFPFYASAANFGDITRGAEYWTEAPNVASSKNNFYFAITANISGQGRSSSEWGSVAESKTTINGAANQVMRFPIHTGNYPILGFKVTKLDLLGTGMKVRLDVNSTQDTSSPGTNTYVGRYMPVRYTGAAENRHQMLNEDGEAGTGVYYIDLSASNVQFKNGTTESNETLPNTRTLHFTTFNLQFRDIVPGSAGTMDIYWIGFFNSKKELETFAAAH